MKSQSAQGTQGTVEVVVEGAHNLSFQGDADKMSLYQEASGRWHLAATQRLSGDTRHFLGLDIYLPADLPSDGTATRYRFADGNAQLRFWAYENESSSPYNASEGELEVTFDGTHLKASFSATAYFGKRRITLKDGRADLTGISLDSLPEQPANGRLNATFRGGPLPTPDFAATTLRIISTDFGGHRPDYRSFSGDSFDQQQSATRTIISVVVYKDVSGLTHDLADHDKVRVHFGRLDTYGILTAHAGRLTLNGPVTDEQGSGTFSCSFRRNNEPEFTVEGTFDLTRAAG